MKFIELTEIGSGIKHIINAFKIISIKRHRVSDDLECTFIRGDGFTFYVKNKYEDFVDLLCVEGV